MFFSAPFRNSLDKARPAAIFCGVAAGIAFFTIWLPPDGATRYFMPLYPCVAVLVGIVIDRLLSAPAALVSNRPLRIWITVIVGCYLAIAIGLPIASLIMSSGRHANYVPVLSHALFYSLCLAVVSIVIFLNRRLLSQRNYLVTVIAIALGAAVISNGVIDDARIRRSSDTEASVARVKELLPRGTSLVSLGHLRHLFTYYYDTFIPARPLPPSPQDVGPGDYFCFNWQGDGTPKLPFGWTEIARVKVNRFSDEKPAKWVIVARRT
jgi:hypothetical protein